MTPQEEAIYWKEKFDAEEEKVAFYVDKLENKTEVKALRQQLWCIVRINGGRVAIPKKVLNGMPDEPVLLWETDQFDNFVITAQSPEYVTKD